MFDISAEDVCAFVQQVALPFARSSMKIPSSPLELLLNFGGLPIQT